MFDLPRLRRDIKPFRLHWFPRLRSTNDHAALLRKRGDLYAPAIVLTGHQIAGRGRGSNTWWSGEGSLTVTFVLAADEHLAPFHVPLIAGLAVRNAAAGLADHAEIQLKWPNDLLFRGKKLAGLLCERVYKADLIGVGLNVNVDLKKVPPLLRKQVTSLEEISGHSIDMTNTLAAIAAELHRTLSHRDEQNFAAILREYDRHHALLGKRVMVTGSGETGAISGRCEGLDDMGRLLLRERKKLHRVIAGQVQML
jgi:BirA family transcriptional regulator, biotin operon repressor / biotin---[acetyl-CoA-carboxylase] ligase